MKALIAQIFMGRKGIGELATLIEEGALVCNGVAIWRRPKLAVAVVVTDLVDSDNAETAEIVELEKYEGTQMFIGDADTFNAKMIALAEQGYYVTVNGLNISKKGLVICTFSADFRNEDLPEDCTCNGSEEHPCEACKQAAKMPPDEDEPDNDALEVELECTCAGEGTCPACKADTDTAETASEVAPETAARAAASEGVTADEPIADTPDLMVPPGEAAAAEEPADDEPPAETAAEGSTDTAEPEDAVAEEPATTDEAVQDAGGAGEDEK